MYFHWTNIMKAVLNDEGRRPKRLQDYTESRVSIVSIMTQLMQIHKHMTLNKQLNGEFFNLQIN